MLWKYDVVRLIFQNFLLKLNYFIHKHSLINILFYIITQSTHQNYRAFCYILLTLKLYTVAYKLDSIVTTLATANCHIRFHFCRPLSFVLYHFHCQIF